jgi:hypothetical protein
MPDEQQGPGQQATGDATGQQQGGNAGTGNGGTGDDKKFTQAELDAILKDRLDQERRRREREAESAKGKADEERLKEQQKFQELADQRQKRIDELEPIRAKADRYEAALTAHLEAERKNLPVHITTLLDKLDPADQLEWIAANREAISKDAGDGKAQRGTPLTPKAQNGTQHGADDTEAVRQRLIASGNYPRF